ncbi:hypothetical protein Kpol_1036p12 [Vanderwaltozyma polyspora DSM 70294]|uniref:N-terminal acetyltransferase B complex subunit MDM20 n=1 Tax=Vanderwaltozyma polyspora (strain ATCC 22028 / DSM 70294 / BCRC 21397 / CBS 2163 / NBRC 10782 / NRRL Y-8283 / UCD 57-17) TaxID=436907 RepID=A7TEG3_VANPO|nr:uncharacterized protein Kpol_1036p12 [Vanderwaltozyma polyspora DSM 70294]EDO19270.1 hypothetical protein Kpol_1036p12 [Vanderwaltozyma polyspora DSM 70294]
MSDKIEAEIFELIKKSNFRLCNERIGQLRRQYPKSSYFEVLETYIKYKQSPTKFDYEKLLGEKFGINGKLITSDLKALDLLHTFFIELERYPESLNVYERAIFKYPTFELASAWFDKSLNDSNFMHMAKASLQMVKYSNENSEYSSYLQNRDFNFWYGISIAALFKFQPHRITEQEKRILPTLAYKTISNLKPFNSHEELIVFCTICEQLFPNDRAKASEIVQEIFPTLEKSVNLTLKNFIVHNASIIEDNQLLFNSCQIILKSIDDYDVIKHFLRSGKALGKSKQELGQLILSLVGDTRNYRLSFLEGDLIYDSKITDDSLKFYLEKFHNKACSSIDINNYKNHLDEATIKSTFNLFSSEDVIHDANTFKLNINDSTSSELYMKHKESLNSKAITDYSSNSVFILDLVQKLLLKEDPSLEDILLSLTLLENYQVKDEHNFDTKLWIIVSYMHLGCIPIAYSNYLDLKIKNVQNDIIDHLIYSRMSTLFPQKQHDYFINFRESIRNLYEGSLNRLPQFIRIAFERKAYSKILGMIEFRDKLERSSMKWLKEIEMLQLAGISNDKRGPLIKKMQESWRNIEITGNITFSDNRDWSSFNCNINKKELPNIMRSMQVSETAIMINIIKELMIDAVSTNSTNGKIDELILSTFNNDMSKILEMNLTEDEIWSFNIIFDLYKNNGENLTKLLSAETIPLSNRTMWNLSHGYLMKVGTLKTLDNIKRIKDPVTKSNIKKQLQDLRGSADDLYKSYSNKIKQAHENLASNDETNKLLQDLGFVPLQLSRITETILMVQKTVRNL